MDGTGKSTWVERFAVTKLRADSHMTGELFEMSASSRSSPDGKYRFVWTLAPGKRGPGEHYHERETETFEIVSGTLRIWIDGVARDYAHGDRVAIPAGVRHKFLNPGAEPVVVNVTLDGHRMEDAFVPLAVVALDHKPTFGDYVRFTMALAPEWPSTPVAAWERSVMLLAVKVFGWLGVERFPPVIGWDGDPRYVAGTPDAPPAP